MLFYNFFYIRNILYIECQYLIVFYEELIFRLLDWVHYDLFTISFGNNLNKIQCMFTVNILVDL